MGKRFLVKRNSELFKRIESVFAVMQSEGIRFEMCGNPIGLVDIRTYQTYFLEDNESLYDGERPVTELSPTFEYKIVVNYKFGDD